MKIDITLMITPEMLKDAEENKNPALKGHLGTHFDVMDKEFPLDYTRLDAVVFDVSGVGDRDIDISDVDTDRIKSHCFVAFYSGYCKTEKYGTARYYGEHPQLSMALIELMLEKQVSVIGLDFAGVRRGKEHTPTDQLCADRGVFIIENLRNLDEVLNAGRSPVIHTYPLNCTGISGLPCRVIAEIN